MSNTATENSIETQATLGESQTLRRLKEKPSFRNVLLCTDLSEISSVAAEAAAYLCRESGATLTVLHVCDYGPLPAFSAEDFAHIDGLFKERRDGLQRVIEQLKGLGVSAEPQMFDGNTKNIILDYIDCQDIDLVIMGTHAAKGIERFVFGSTAEAVMEQSGCPALLVSPTANRQPYARSRPVIFATDFQKPESDAIRFAEALALAEGSPLYCVHVLPATLHNDEDPVVSTIILGAMQKLTTCDEACTNPPALKVLYGSDVSYAVVDFAKQINAQAIVLGTKKRSRVASHFPPDRLFRMVLTAPCPVLAVPFETKSHLSHTQT